jgi:flagellar protein FlbD
MIKVTRLNHTSLILNSDLIEHIEITPDTVITLTSGQKFMVLESAQEILEEVIAFRKALFSKELFCPVAAPHAMQTRDRPCEALAGETSSHGR